MLDTKALEELVEKQITKTVNDQVLAVISTEDWIKPLEEKVIRYSQEKILKKFSSSEAVPEIVEAVKTGVERLFSDGAIPGIDQYVNQDLIRSTIDMAVEQTVDLALDKLTKDPSWIAKIETLINQTVVQRTLAQVNTLDVPAVIKKRVDENIERFHKQLEEELTNKGIQDRSDQVELTALNGHVVVENKLITKDFETLETAVINNLSVTGSINVDGECWNDLSAVVAESTLEKLSEQWRYQLIEEVKTSVAKEGINFTNINIDNVPLISEGSLSSAVVDSKLETVGVLKELTVAGEASINDTVKIVNQRLGINTTRPEMALSVWDEEVVLVAGRYKANSGYIGTARLQNLTLGVNREPAIEIDVNGITTIKKAKIGIHRIAFEPDAPGYSGTKGDIVFNSNPSVDAALAWQCLGGHKWKTIKAIS